MDDRRVGLIVRALRRRRRWRQQDVADVAGVSQATVSRLERAHLDHLAIGAVRRILGAVDARTEIEVRWRGERHAAVGVRVTTALRDLGWQVIPEVTFQRYGERGSSTCWLLAGTRWPYASSN